MDKHLYHHGLLFKNYVINNGINKKGVLKQLTEALGITRQGIYALYEQREIKKKHREKIIQHLGLPDNFFPEAPSLEEEYKNNIVELQKRLIDSQDKVIKLEEKLKQSVYTPRFFPVIVDTNNEDKMMLIPRKAVAGYVKNEMDKEFIAGLQTFSLPNFNSGFGFEIEGNSMNKSGLHDKDYALCEYMVERIEEVKPKTNYIVILNSEDIVCKFIEPTNDELILISSNTKYKPYNIHLKDVFQIWKVKGKFTPNLI